MTVVTSFPGFETMKAWEPPEPPFHWRNFGQPIDYLFDSRNRQIFKDCAAVWRAAEPAPPAPEKEVRE